ncbi:PREDICTED: F-box protein At1g52490-like [Camelina sativa]|uniref:F-box protein At1g52490-like n=1 Tax=Camelina sativa TaxID=90675 RepID=A0ABM0X2S8_CAMSA|nr:PREDICTED: F-box protein At1g52490-like [Camelina sativa]
MQKRNEERLAGSQLSLDLIVEILKKLPSKSLVRFRCVSKEWSTIISSRRDFIEAIVARSLLAQQQQQQQPPLFVFHHCVPEPFFTLSSTFSESIKEAVSVFASPGPGCTLFEYQYVRGLICCYSTSYQLFTIYNPTTRQSLRLPLIEDSVTEFRRYICHFGYDAVMDQYKVMSIVFDVREFSQTFHVFTLGRSQQSWRRIKGIDDEKLLPSVDAVCIHGTIYYGATRITKKANCAETDDSRRTFDRGETVLLSFDIRSERFYHVSTPEPMLKASSCTIASSRTLLNHKGKLGCIYSGRYETCMWVMESARKQEWSKITFDLPEHPLGCLKGAFSGFSGVTPAGEIFATQNTYFFREPLYVYYYDMNRNSFRRVEIQGTRPEKVTRKNRYAVTVLAIHDHVENTMLLLL